MKQDIISITGMASVSAMGMGAQEVWNAYLKEGHCLSQMTLNEHEVWVGSCPQHVLDCIQEIRAGSPRYASLDTTVRLAMLASRKAFEDAGWALGDAVGVNIGSSRGATELFESSYRNFLKTGKTSVFTSPNTTLGNISFWVAQDLQSRGPEFSHSITCSTALHAVLNGVAWLRSGLAKRFLAGGSEAALTPFTLAQLQSLRIYSREHGKFPSRAMDFEKESNTMVLGSGASMACLEVGEAKNPLAHIKGIGYASEVLDHPAALSANANCIQNAMRMALSGYDTESVDVVVLHAPGTLKGDQAELRAIQEVFGSQTPALTGNKWKIGHTFGASGMFSLELAVLMLVEQVFIPTPFNHRPAPNKLNTILVNSVGFGGNAVSILLERP